MTASTPFLDREKPEVWTLDHVATPLADPNLLRAPFLDPRPVKFDKLIKDGETVKWREYRLRLPLPAGTDRFHDGRGDDDRR